MRAAAIVAAAALIATTGMIGMNAMTGMIATTATIRSLETMAEAAAETIPATRRARVTSLGQATQAVDLTHQRATTTTIEARAIPTVRARMDDPTTLGETQDHLARWSKASSAG